MSKSMCGCGCSIISSLMKRLGRSTCCSDLLSCSHTSDQLQKLSIKYPNQPKKNVKTFASSDSLGKVQEVANWLLEMNHDLISVGSKRRRTGGSIRGNTSSSQVDEEQMNRVVEEEQQLRQQDEVVARNGEIGGGQPGLCHRNESQLEENNNRFIEVDEDYSGNQEEEEEDEHTGIPEEEEDMEEEEEMDQDSDDFDQSDESSRDEQTNCNSITNSNGNMDLAIHQQSSPFYIKSKNFCLYSLKYPKIRFLLISVRHDEKKVRPWLGGPFFLTGKEAL
ncbi:F-box/WD repeat-containing protein 7 isoform X6 [Ahaetulla prasina]|uniref:F-box/WD repeat-containing protein 7 isoform X6 n=1 Tax=Ahaetulla prasina TaxID=499056 RepID=UPI0026474D64|nr:F-box/WD repeat-containing protein 7 isoform X6 [Ahaetulla prasina]